MSHNDVSELLRESAFGRDLVTTVFGKVLGRGQFRTVYVYNPDPSLVIKVENQGQSFSNVREWDLWHDACEIGDHAKKWLAPVHFISNTGVLLLQERTTPATKYPEKVPCWMTDTKRENFGVIGRRFVAHDFGNSLVADFGMSTKRLKKARWWSEDDSS